MVDIIDKRVVVANIDRLLTIAATEKRVDRQMIINMLLDLRTGVTNYKPAVMDDIKEPVTV